MNPESQPEKGSLQINQREMYPCKGLHISKSKVDPLVVEEPLEIRIQGKALVVTMRTPGHDPELAAGYLWSEGLIPDPSTILDLAHCRRGSEPDENVLNVFLRPDILIESEQYHRFSFANSGCGLCGKASIESIHTVFPPIASSSKVSLSILHGLLDALQGHQPVFDQTGGLHAAALFTYDGKLLTIREDIGRHNAVDKVIGSNILNSNYQDQDRILFVTSRASFEIIQKALALRAPIVACASAPSSLAVEFAEANGQTLIGFMREGQFNIYTHHDRLLAP